MNIDRRRRALIISGIAALGFAAHPSRAATSAGTLAFVGTHGSGPGQGIFVARLDESTGILTPLGLAAEVERPTWLACDPDLPVLYAVSEVGNDGTRQGEVCSFRIDTTSGRLSKIGQVPSGGSGATFLTYDPRLSSLFVANYGGGQVSAIPVLADGRLAAASSVQLDVGSGPHKRQKGPHAHAVAVDPSGRYVLAADLGADRVFIYRYDANTGQLSPAAIPEQVLPPGSGPRHIVFSPDGRFVFLNTELTGEAYSYRWSAEDGRLTEVARTALDAPDYNGSRSAAEIAVSSDGRFLYASNRGANLMQVYAIDERSGALSAVQRIPCGGSVPWSFAIDPTGCWLIVVNEASNGLSVFAVDPADGRLRASTHTLPVQSPVAIAYHRY